ncbi:hypothetical protein FHS81_000989 [Pseudochelatococcus contaminans]|uniref:Uncharacterized protein n=1 Tax=Pseudochelatococcus contaminans TaxID=1538103 RepID=A0A7W5Z2R4_9HYPH|nr:hypothetical protein [Pseudochelatococcus contaminans]
MTPVFTAARDRQRHAGRLPFQTFDELCPKTTRAGFTESRPCKITIPNDVGLTPKSEESRRLSLLPVR